MKMIKISTVASTVLLALASNVFAAEDAAGVKEHMVAFLQKTKDAQASATAGNKDECVTNIKEAKQHYKQLTGDPAGKPTQDAIKLLKVGQEECEKGDTAKATTTLADVVGRLEKINATVK